MLDADDHDAEQRLLGLGLGIRRGGRRRLRDGRWGNKGLKWGALPGIVKGRFAEAGVYGSRKSTHSLRHTAITAAIRAGADPMQVRAMARHESLDTTLIYVHETGRLDNPAEDLIDYE